MAIRVFSDEYLERLRSFPEINREELIRFFTLTPAEVEFIDPGRDRGPSDRHRLAVQLCTLRWLGFVPDVVSSAPAVAVARLSERLQVPVSELRAYGERDQTRTDHLRSAARYLGWRQASALEVAELDEFLFVGGVSRRSYPQIGGACVSYTLGGRRSPASIGVVSLGLQQDDLGLQTDHLCEQCLLVIGECAAPQALGRELHLH
jgi:hypothetical protein